MEKYPKNGKRKYFENEKYSPSYGWSHLTRPKEGGIYCIRMEFFVMAWKSPYFFSLLIKIIPPSKSHQKPASDIFDCPEVESAENDNYDEGIDICEEIS